MLAEKKNFNGGNCFTGGRAYAQYIYRLENSPGGLTGGALTREQREVSHLLALSSF